MGCFGSKAEGETYEEVFVEGLDDSLLADEDILGCKAIWEKFDAIRELVAIKEFIRQQREFFNRKKAVILLSGGIDSVVTLYIARTLYEPSDLTVIFAHDDEVPRDAYSCARFAADQCGIQLQVVDFRKALESLDIYKKNPLHQLVPVKALRPTALKAYNAKSKNTYLDLLMGRAGAFSRSGEACYKVKHRMRMMLAYFEAERNNAMVIGCGNAVEYYLETLPLTSGLCVKGGCDTIADIMPIGHLLKTQVWKIAKELGVPGYLIKREPSPEMAPGMVDRDVLGQEYRYVDACINSFLGGVPSEVEIIVRSVLKQCDEDGDELVNGVKKRVLIKEGVELVCLMHFYSRHIRDISISMDRQKNFDVGELVKEFECHFAPPEDTDAALSPLMMEEELPFDHPVASNRL